MDSSDRPAPAAAGKAHLLQQLRIERAADENGSRRWLLWAALGLLLIGAAVTVYLWLHAAPIAVESAQAAPPSGASGPSAILQATGYVTARREATVSTQITGTLTSVSIEEGEHVKAGQVLAQLDDSAQKAALEQARAQLSAARALLVQYQAQLAQARRDNQRNADLIDRKLVSQQALETTQTQVATLEAEVESQRRQVDLADAGVQGARVQLDYTTVRAPFAGVIIAKAAQPGEIVSPISAGGGFTRTGVGTIVDMDSLEIEVDVNEAYIHRVQPQQKAQAVLDAYPDWTIPAHVIAIIPTADRSKATVKVRVAIDQKDPRILPDMGVRVSFLEQASNDEARPAAGGVLVPAAAIVQRNGSSVVFVIDGSHARVRSVSAGQSFGDLRQVEGLAAGTRVVRSPPEALRDGAAIVVGKQ